MKLAFTRSKLPLSVFIRWGLKEDVSHVVLVFDDKIAFHSNLLGCHVEWYNTFKKGVTVVDELEFKLPLEVEEQVYQSTINKYDGRGYDYKAFFYFVYKAFAHRFFGQPMPKTSGWGDKRKFICTGLVAELPEEYFPQLKGLDLEIMSPGQLRDILKK